MHRVNGRRVMYDLDSSSPAACICFWQDGTRVVKAPSFPPPEAEAVDARLYGALVETFSFSQTTIRLTRPKWKSEQPIALAARFAPAKAICYIKIWKIIYLRLRGNGK